MDVCWPLVGDVRRGGERGGGRRRSNQIDRFTHSPRITGVRPSHEINDLLTMEVDDAEGFAGWEVEGVAVGGGDDVGFCLGGGVEEGEGGEDLGWIGEGLGFAIDAGVGFGMEGVLLG
jgi:hypothetical protein